MTVDDSSSDQVELGGASAMTSGSAPVADKSAAASGTGSAPVADKTTGDPKPTSNRTSSKLPRFGRNGGARSSGPKDAGSADAATGRGGDAATSGGNPFDENTLGRSTSVFDSGVDYVPSAIPPNAPAPGAPYPGPYGEAPYTDDSYVEAPPERSLTSRERRRRVKLEARRVRRIVRHFELWSVLKVSVIFYFCMWLILLLAGVLLWSFAERSGTLESIEDLVESLFALDETEDFWSGGTIFRAYMIGTLALSIAGITFNVLLAALYNLISDLTGGVRLTVIEEESARFVPPRRRPRR